MPQRSTVVTSPLGSPIPAILPHAISVSLPTWKDNVDYEEGAKRVVDVMKTGYPRFFIHKSIVKLANICEQKFGVGDEQCMLFPSNAFAVHCRDFVMRMDASSSPRIVHFFICPDGVTAKVANDAGTAITSRCGDLYIVLFSSSYWKHAKAFWQHTGMGISSRFADHCLRLLATQNTKTISSQEAPPKSPVRGRNRHYFSRSKGQDQAAAYREEPEVMDDYLEERYARNLPRNAAVEAKKSLKARISGACMKDKSATLDVAAPVSNTGTRTRGVPNVSEEDVFLFQGGMCAIWHTHHLLLKTLGNRKSICWGFPYVDTLKILEKWGPGCYFYGNGEEYDKLESQLQEIQAQNKVNGKENEPPVLALFCEVTSNPLLKTPDLRRLRELADKYDFCIVVDETIGNFVNVDVLPYADVVCSSLTKVFSGETNVMGGGMILNPKGRHHSKLKASLLEFYEDTYWDEDSIFLERNSRDFKSRVAAISRNAEEICDLLYSHSLEASQNSECSSPLENPVVKKVCYPKFVATDLYNAIKNPDGGYGGLCSITFTSPLAAQAFFDNLGSEKGPSLGTNFTLACPFVILAHYTELDWVKQFDIDPYLVRISVGLEDRTVLIGWIEEALRAAEAAVKKGHVNGNGTA